MKFEILPCAFLVDDTIFIVHQDRDKSWTAVGTIDVRPMTEEESGLPSEIIRAAKAWGDNHFGQGGMTVVEYLNKMFGEP